MWNREKQSLLEESRKSLRRAEEKIELLNIENKDLKEIRIEVEHSNTILVNKNREQTRLLSEIADRAFSCPLDSEKIVLDKIKELVRDYQSEKLTQI